MRSMFRKVIWASTFGIATMLAANSAMAAAKVNVPFSFTVAGKTLPAGNYHVIHDSTSSFVTLQNVDSAQSFTWLLSPGQPSPNSEKVTLRFDNQNDTHALQSIQFGSMVTPRLDKIKNEKRASERASPGQ